jgi:murein L,D-transpeptidase YcbB/YkuD
MSSRKSAGAGYLASFVLLASLCGATAQAMAGAPRDAAATDAVCRELQRALASPDLSASATPLDYSALDAFYRDRGYQPAWCDAQGVNPVTQRWLSVLTEAARESANPAVRHLDDIQRQLNAAAPRERAMLDLLLSDAFLHYVRVVAEPRLKPQGMGVEWYLPQPSVDPARVLENALGSGQFDKVIASLGPQQAAYRRLRERLVDYLEKQARGGWPPFLTRGERLLPGMNSEEIPVLRDLLTATGDLADGGQETVYDGALEQAVRRFQRRHGLAVDGVIGRATRAALAVPVEQRIAQLRINLERWRWLPRDLGERYITVNSAAFELQAHEGDSVPLTMRVIVGKQDRETPVFMEDMRYLVVNPYWHVPGTIARNDLIPAFLRDHDYFARMGIRVLSGRGADAVEVDAAQVAWQDYLGDRELPYRLRQDPGPRNSLGRIKFMMPNLHSVYLHDTPARSLFDRPVRAFSSGCIRVEEPLALANYVLGSDSRSKRMLDRLLESGATGTLALPEPVPVYLLYLTAWVDADGMLQFRDDIYRRDRKLLAALPELAPQAAQTAGKSPRINTASLLHPHAYSR